MLINIPSNLNTPEPVPAGIYRVAVTGYKLKTSQAGNQMVCPEYTIQTQVAADGITKVQGRKLFDNFVMSEAALPVVNSKYKALTGVDLPAGQFELEEFMNLVSSNIINKECLVQVEVEEGTNGPRNAIKRMTAIGA